MHEPCERLLQHEKACAVLEPCVHLPQVRAQLVKDAVIKVMEAALAPILEQMQAQRQQQGQGEQQAQQHAAQQTPASKQDRATSATSSEQQQQQQPAIMVEPSMGGSGGSPRLPKVGYGTAKSFWASNGCSTHPQLMCNYLK
jgi:hypothetical protein